jgi:hypothetical protein
MNVKLRFDLNFRAGNWYDNEFLVNSYGVKLQLITQSQDPEDHPVCIGRIRTVFELLENTVFINQHNQDKIQELTSCGFRVIAFPQEPIDQIVGVVLFEKLNSVLEGRMKVTDLDLNSDCGGNIWFLHSDHETVNEIPDLGWWAEPGPSCNDYHSANQGKKVVKLKKPMNWKLFDLDWESNQSGQTVIINLKDDK